MDGILHLWESLKADNVDPVYALSEVLASCEKDHAVVAVQGEQVVGAAVGRAAHDQGWIVFLATLPEFRGRGIGTSRAQQALGAHARVRNPCRGVPGPRLPAQAKPALF
jgi:ribosomal protein S18 acetylase RimI-like enzyme